MKKIFYNLKLANSKLIWCIVALFIMLSFAVKVDCSDGFKKSIINLPKAENGIEKIEYMVNGEAKGSTDGINSIELEPGAKLTFAVKFEPQGYNKLHVRNVKIKSENGSVLKLNTYARDDEGNFVLMRVLDSELVNPGQTYISSDYIVDKDDKLYFEGIEEDKYRVRIADENNDVNLFDAVKLRYAENGGSYVDAEFSESENAFFINNLTKSSNVKLMFEIKEGYTDSNLSLTNGENQIAIDEKSRICTLPELTDDINLEIRNLEKNSYDVNFNEYSNAKFSYRIAGSEDEFKSSEIVKVNYGDSLEIKCDASSEDILESGAVTANGKAIAFKDGIYTLENIKNHLSIAITPKASAVYTVSLPENEDRIKLCDTFGNEVSEIDAKQNESIDFKIVPSDAYKKNFILASMYAVPMSRLSGGQYDLSANAEEAESFLMLPSGDCLYTLKNINEPVKIIAGNMEKNVYTVTLPDKIIGADIEVETNENVTRLTENKFRVVHGSDLAFNLEPQAGYDLSEINVSDASNSSDVQKYGNKYTFKSIDGDKYLIINGASIASCKVSLDGNDVVAMSEGGSAWKNNTASVKYQEGTLKFKVRPADHAGSSDGDISLSIKSGNGTLEKISSEKNTYSLRGVTGDIVLSANMTQSSDITIKLESDDDDIQFTDANDESVVLPEENTVKYGTDLNFKVVSKSGKSTDNASVSSTVSNPITESDASSNTYSVRALRSGATLVGTRNSDERKYGQYVDLCEKLHVGANEYNHAYDATLYQASESTIPAMFLVFSKDAEACECINAQKDFNLGMAEWHMVDGAYQTGANNFHRNSESDPYEIPLSVPGLLDDDDVPLEQSPLTINFNKVTSMYDDSTSYMSTSERFSDRTVPDNGTKPESGFKETNIGDYYAVKDSSQCNIPSGAEALQYLENCYCHSFSRFYPTVKLINNIKKDGLHNVDVVDFRDLENLTNDFSVSTDVRVNGGTGDLSVNLRPVMAKFKIYFDENKKFADGVTEPLCLNSGAHAKLTQRLIQDDEQCYVECELLITPFDENVELNWSENSTIEARQHDITFSSNDSAVFKNSQEIATNSDKVDHKEGLIFYTEPKEGYEYADSLKITKYQTTYNLDNITKIKILNDETSEQSEDYNGEWIKLSESGLFIRASKDNSQIKYEIAGSTEAITTYIAKIGSTSDSKYKRFTDQSETPEGITTNLKIHSTRLLRQVSVTFSYAEGIEYTEIDATTPIPAEPEQLNYGEARAFKIKAKNGYDISNIQVTASTATNTNILPLTNGMYVIVNITEPTTVSVSGIEKSNISLTFEQYEGIKYKNTSGGEYLTKQQIPYNQEIIFQVEVDEAHSQNADKIKAKFNDTEFETSPAPEGQPVRPYVDKNFYIIPSKCVNQDIAITLEGLEINTYTASLKPSTGIKYYDSTGENILSENNSGINYGNSFKFRLKADTGYDTSNIEVIAKSNSGNGSPVTLIPANGIYTIDNITSDYIVTVSGVAKQQHTVEFRTVTGVACIDSYGKTLPSSVTVSDGDDYSFYLSFDPAYSKSKDTADVTIKGSNNKVPRDSNGKYTLSSITENKIVEIINVTKNSYTATFVPAEGVIYRTAKGKEFNGTLNVEYGESLYFKLSLLDAYDQSTPAVKMNGTKSLLENSGSYVLENISEDVTITVENVEKNAEEVTIDTIRSVPDPVTNEDDVNAVVAATKAYNSLSDDEKKLVTNKQALEKAQNEAGNINHNSNGVSISGVDWNIKLIVTPLSDNEEEKKSFSEELDRRTLLSLYRVELIDLLTGESYNIPYGSEVQITIPCPDLTGYKNVTIAHINLADNMEYLDPSIVDGTAKFSATSAGRFGVAAKEIPNYSENTSDMSISMGSLVSDDDELKTLLGEDLSSQLGHLIDMEDENSGNDNSSSDKNDNRNSSGGTEGSDSLLNGMANGALSFVSSAYNWMLDNEFWAVMAILLLGSLLILIILLANRKKDKEDKNLKKMD